MIPISLAIALLLVGGALGFIVGKCHEACRRGGSVDLHQQVYALDVQRKRLIELYVRATNPHRLPAQRNLSGPAVSGLNVGDCAAEGCAANVPAGKLMCLPHWRSVPGEIRAEVNSAWNAHRTNVGRQLRPGFDRALLQSSRARYEAARTAAIDSVQPEVADARA